MTISDHFI